MTDPAEISLLATGDRNTLIGNIGNIGVFNHIIQFTSLQALEQKQKLNTNSPYKGLKSFDDGDRELFFGRDVFLKERYFGCFWKW